MAEIRFILRMQPVIPFSLKSLAQRFRRNQNMRDIVTAVFKGLRFMTRRTSSGNARLDYYEKFPPKLKMWFIEAHKEANHWNEDILICTDYALYPRRFYKQVDEFSPDKVFDFCFIGGFKTDRYTEKNRAWIIEFINNNFTDKSYLQFTDLMTKKNYVSIGNFDYTSKKDGFVPKEYAYEKRNKFDENYFRNMAKSKFALCPAGDAFWSMRFYEALMCRSIPIVNSVNETFRSKKESELDYKYYLTTDNIKYREDWVEHNYAIFLKYHTLDGLFV